MKLQNLLCVMCALIALPMLANAEIYKWKDKDGTVRYTDTPPPSNIKQESIGGKKLTKPTGQAPLAPVANTDATATADKDEMKAKVPHQNIEGPDEIAAKLRQKNAEADKNNKKQKEAQAKIKEENCKASKANLASYQQGGAVYKINEKGEREYLDDAGFKAGAEKAQKDVTEYCSG